MKPISEMTYLTAEMTYPVCGITSRTSATTDMYIRMKLYPVSGITHPVTDPTYPVSGGRGSGCLSNEFCCDNLGCTPSAADTVFSGVRCCAGESTEAGVPRTPADASSSEDAVATLHRELFSGMTWTRFAWAYSSSASAAASAAAAALLMDSGRLIFRVSSSLRASAVRTVSLPIRVIFVGDITVSPPGALAGAGGSASSPVSYTNTTYNSTIFIGKANQVDLLRD